MQHRDDRPAAVAVERRAEVQDAPTAAGSHSGIDICAGLGVLRGSADGGSGRRLGAPLEVSNVPADGGRLGMTDGQFAATAAFRGSHER